MPNANIIELETSLDDCLTFCRENPDNEYASRYLNKLTQAKQRWYKSVEVSESHHVRWRTEEREEMIVRKQISSLVREVQIRLKRLGAVDFPSERLLYWDEERLLRLVDQVVVYLGEHSADIPFSTEYLERFDRLLSSLKSETKEREDALKGYQRFIDLRRESMNDLASLIGEFRIALRRSLGKKNPKYQQIRWPFAIASDEGVLF